MKEMLEALREASRRAIEEAQDMDALDTLRVRYLGKKGELTAILKQMGRLSAEERPVVGQLANAVRAELESELDRRKAALAARLQELKLEAETLDVTIPGRELRLDPGPGTPPRKKARAQHRTRRSHRHFHRHGLLHRGGSGDRAVRVRL